MGATWRFVAMNFSSVVGFRREACEKLHAQCAWKAVFFESAALVHGAKRMRAGRSGKCAMLSVHRYSLPEPINLYTALARLVHEREIEAPDLLMPFPSSFFSMHKGSLKNHISQWIDETCFGSARDRQFSKCPEVAGNKSAFHKMRCIPCMVDVNQRRKACHVKIRF